MFFFRVNLNFLAISKNVLIFFSKVNRGIGILRHGTLDTRVRFLLKLLLKNEKKLRISEQSN